MKSYNSLLTASIVPLLISIGCNSCLNQRINCDEYAQIHSECEFKTKGRVIFNKKDKSKATLLLEDGNSQGVDWPITATSYHLVDASKTYTIIYSEDYFFDRYSNGKKLKNRELRLIADVNHAIYDASICKVHCEKMKRQEAIMTRDYDPDNDYFSNYNNPIHAPNDGYDEVVVCSSFGMPSMTWVCESCRKWTNRKRLQYGKK